MKMIPNNKLEVDESLSTLDIISEKPKKLKKATQLRNIKPQEMVENTITNPINDIVCEVTNEMEIKPIQLHITIS
jgi:hypothetical protein